MRISLTYSSIPKGGIKEKMKTLRKIRKSTKALSPVVASIILIAVTVAVSIAVAAWMGALASDSWQTEEIRITNVELTTGTDAILSQANTGSTACTITEAYNASATVKLRRQEMANSRDNNCG
jgi:flagellin-like protein